MSGQARGRRRVSAAAALAGLNLALLTLMLLPAAVTAASEPLTDLALIDLAPTDAAPTDVALTDVAPAPDAGPARGTGTATAHSALLIVAVADGPEVRPGVGGSPRADYRRPQNYAGSARALALAAELARDHALQPQDAWSIAPLGLRCTLFRTAPGADPAAVLAALARDPRVRLAQPLNEFETLQARPGETVPVAVGTRLPYNDPYLGLQRGFAALGAAEAQRRAQGQGVRVAVIDTGIDAAHPDLQGRVTGQRDFAAASHPMAGSAERHGTAVAGVIAAGANNGIGIAGIAPQAQLLGLRACWAVAHPAGAARCDSFTLAQALGAAITAEADVINLSLGGPADPLLTLLATHAMAQGAVVVGALPPGGRRSGFPSGVPGVLAVGSSDDAPAGGETVLTAPGRDILSLAPGGRYDFSSGSSLAAAHVSGAVALLRSLRRGLRGDEAQRWLAPPVRGPVDACSALRWHDPAVQCSAASRPLP